MSSRDTILGKLRTARDPFPDLPGAGERQHVSKLADTSPAALRARFIEEATALKCKVTEAASEGDALETLIELLGDEKRVMAWDAAHIPLNGLDEALAAAGVERTSATEGDVNVGITGVDAALAATGSLVVVSDAGKPRGPSLLPLEHIAVLKADRIVADLEAFYGTVDRETFKNSSNIAVISGPSKSADIAMTMIHGMHGPGSVHIIIVP